MAGGVVVLGGMLVPGRVAAADVAADQILTEMDPGVAALQTVLTAVRARGHVADLIQVRTGCHRSHSPCRFIVATYSLFVARIAVAGPHAVRPWMDRPSIGGPLPALALDERLLGAPDALRIARLQAVPRLGQIGALMTGLIARDTQEVLRLGRDRARREAAQHLLVQ